MAEDENCGNSQSQSHGSGGGGVSGSFGHDCPSFLSHDHEDHKESDENNNINRLFNNPALGDVGELEPILNSCINELNNDEGHLSDIAKSEQELIEKEFYSYIKMIRERFQGGVDELQQKYIQEYRSVHQKDHDLDEHYEQEGQQQHSQQQQQQQRQRLGSDGSSLDSELTPRDVIGELMNFSSVLLSDLKSFEEKVFQEISHHLDSRFTKFRQSFLSYKKKTLEKLFQARKSIVEYKKMIHLSSQSSAHIQLHLRIKESEASQAARMTELTTELTRYRSAYEMSSNKGTILEMEKVELLDKITRLEVRLTSAEDRANRANRRAVTLEEQINELNRQIEDLNTQKLLRQQIGNRKKTLGSTRQQSVSSPSNQTKPNRRGLSSDQCPKCIILEDMMTEIRKEIDEKTKTNEDLKNSQLVLEKHNEDLRIQNEFLVAQEDEIRAAAAAELEMARKLIEQVPVTPFDHLRPSMLRVDTDHSGSASPQDESDTPSAPVNEEEVDDRPVSSTDTNTIEQDSPGYSVNKLKDAISLDKQLSNDRKIASSQNSFDTSQVQNTDSSSENHGQSSSTRVSMSVFPTKKEVISLTPVPIVMNAQLLEFEKPLSRKQKQPSPAPVETSLPSNPSVPAQPSPFSLPSPSAYLQLYDDRPVTPELGPLVVSPPDVAVQARRASEPVDYLTASQALEKQQRLSLRIQPVVAPEPTPPPEVASNQPVDSPAKSHHQTSYFFPFDPSKSVASEAYDNVMKLLNEALATQRNLETENTALKKSNAEALQHVEEMSAYLKTQEHINLLKLKERDLLLKELTEQVNELRSQIKRDQKLLLEVKKGNSLPVLETKRPPRKIPENSNNSKLFPYKMTNPQLHKLDLQMEEIARPATASGLRSQINPIDNHLLMARPSSSPALPSSDAIPSSPLPSNRPVNLSQSLKIFCGSSPVGKPSLFESQGLAAYEYCDNPTAEIDPLDQERKERETNVKREVGDLRKKITLLMAHQEIVMRRSRLGSHPSTPTSGQHKRKTG